MGENNAGEVFCPQCDLKFDNKSELYIHVSIMHQEDLFPAIEPQMKREKKSVVDWRGGALWSYDSFFL